MKWEPLDLVVYSKQKHSASPGPRAREVDAASRGETLFLYRGQVLGGATGT